MKLMFTGQGRSSAIISYNRIANPVISEIWLHFTPINLIACNRFKSQLELELNWLLFYTSFLITGWIMTCLFLSLGWTIKQLKLNLRQSYFLALDRVGKGYYPGQVFIVVYIPSREILSLFVCYWQLSLLLKVRENTFTKLKQRGNLPTRKHDVVAAV